MIEKNRKFMHCPSFKEKMAESDQAKGIPAPPFSRNISGERIQLTQFEEIRINSYTELLDKRRSVRKYRDSAMTQAELSFLLWSTQGIQEFRGEVATFRPVPSGGARHPFETYVAVRDVEGLASGIYYYSPAENPGEKICTVIRIADLPDEDKLSSMLSEQRWAARGQVILFYSCVPYKAEWRYAETAHRVMLIDLGHVGQNAMLSATALGLGSCCMAAYNQDLCDKTLGFDGVDEYTVYAVAVGANEV